MVSSARGGAVRRRCFLRHAKAGPGSAAIPDGGIVQACTRA